MCLWFRSRPNDGVTYVKKRKLIRDTRLYIIRKKTFDDIKSFIPWTAALFTDHLRNALCLELKAKKRFICKDDFISAIKPK